MLFADMHCDTISKLLALRREGRTVGLRNGAGLHVTLEKLQQGGCLLQNFALFVNLKETADPLAEVLTLADLYETELTENADRMAPVLNYQDVEKNQRAGKLSALLTVEEGGVCRGQLPLLRCLYRLGVRMLTLTWNYENELGWPNTAAKLPGCHPQRSYGLKETGFAFVEEMERLRMIVDVSHLSDDGFWDVCRTAKRPFVASHSDARSLCSHSRNLTDEMLRALADRGGVVGLNFYAPFLSHRSRVSLTADMVRHIRHMITVGGLACVGLGSDFDGIDCPVELEDSAGLPRLVEEMEKQGFTPREIDAVCGQNVLRLYREVLG